MRLQYVPNQHSVKIHFHVIALDAGYMESPISTTHLPAGNGERYEIIVDFTNYANQNVTMRNHRNWVTSRNIFNFPLTHRSGKQNNCYNYDVWLSRGSTSLAASGPQENGYKMKLGISYIMQSRGSVSMELFWPSSENQRESSEIR